MKWNCWLICLLACVTAASAQTMPKDVEISGSWELSDASLVKDSADIGSGSDSVTFLELVLKNAQGHPLSRNVYWCGPERDMNDLTALQSLTKVAIHATISSRFSDGPNRVLVTLHNTRSHIAVMAHAQLRDSSTGKRVLPVVGDKNYVTLFPGESEVIEFQVTSSALHGHRQLVTLDGWNVVANEVRVLLEMCAQIRMRWSALGRLRILEFDKGA